MEDDAVNTEDTALEEEQEEQFETTPEQATGFGASMDAGTRKPGTLNRKKLMIVICCSLAFVIGGGLIFNAAKPAKKKASAVDDEFASSNSSQEFLTGLRDRAVYRRGQEAPTPQAAQETAKEEKEPEPALPPVSFNRPQERTAYPSPTTQQSQPAPSSGSGAPQQNPTHFKSPLVPQIQGSLFSQGYTQGAAQNPSAAARNASDEPSSSFPQNIARNPSGQAYGQVNDYAAQNDQQNKQAFFAPSSGGAVFNGQYLGANAVWTGTIIPGILETAINTDLPGNVLARVTQNIYDSQTGRNLLIPQGTLLLARYNSSISYAQKRIQIVWDTLIRPDGFELTLNGAGGVDRSGMSGQPARFHENWFEYLKAAGIITLFSYANAQMSETAAKYTTEESAANLAASNANFVGELGSKLAGRAMNIQPTLTVENGTLINIMLNKTLYLPPAAGYPASQKYSLE
jgi:type IV secretion system protein VirB10